ncbi:hypothetical protein O1Q82_01378 [Lonepinella sp. MS14437]
MKIVINLNILKYPLTGIGYYTYHIIYELLNRNVELKAIKKWQDFIVSIKYE